MKAPRSAGVRRSFFLRLAVALTLAGAAALAFDWTRYARSLTVDGVERRFELVVEGDARAGPLPLVFVFHGRDRTSWNIRHRLGLDAAAHALGDRGLFVYPQALEFPGTHTVAWQGGCEGPDLRFVDEVVRTLATEYPLDRARLFAAGMSWGGEMAIAVGCCRHDTVRAIAPMSGGTWDGVSDACVAPAPALRLTLGEEDSLAPPTVLRHVVEAFRARQHCSTRTHPTEEHCVAWEDCEAPVIECDYPGLGHQLPPRAGQELWNFFRAF